MEQVEKLEEWRSSLQPNQGLIIGILELERINQDVILIGMQIQSSWPGIKSYQGAEVKACSTCRIEVLALHTSAGGPLAVWSLVTSDLS